MRGGGNDTFYKVGKKNGQKSVQNYRDKTFIVIFAKMQKFTGRHEIFMECVRKCAPNFAIFCKLNFLDNLPQNMKITSIITRPH